jgi:hypothetical protein
VPAAGATLAKRSSVLLQAFASDNRWITKVDFSANDNFVCSSTGGGLTYASVNQFYCWWNVPRRSGTYTLTAKAYDSAGNSATDSITVNVQ